MPTKQPICSRQSFYEKSPKSQNEGAQPPCARPKTRAMLFEVIINAIPSHARHAHCTSQPPEPEEGLAISLLGQSQNFALQGTSSSVLNLHSLKF
jgi:hypothetical protein